MKKKFLVMITIIAVMSWILIPGTFADSSNAKRDNIQQTNEEDIKVENEDKGKGKDKVKDEIKAWVIEKDILEAEKDDIESQKDTLEEQKDILEVQFEEAKESGNIELAQQLLSQIETAKQDIDLQKQLMKQKLNEMKTIVRQSYTTEELVELEKLSEELKNDNEDIVVMPIDSIIAKGKNLKFDTPPVVKAGRTLVPVRALTEAFGATVDWDPIEQKITISNETTQIILQLNNGTAYVNGVEVAIEVPPLTINNRTVVPLRFITETLGLKVDWDDETGTVEIEEEVEEPVVEPVVEAAVEPVVEPTVEPVVETEPVVEVEDTTNAQ